MLVLSRKEGEKIQLGDNITLTVVRIAGDKVRIGIEAPKDVIVLRTELGAATQPANETQSPGVVPAPAKS